MQEKLIALRKEVAELEYISNEIAAIFKPLLDKKMRIYRRMTARTTHPECRALIKRTFFKHSQRLHATETRSMGKIQKRWREKKAELIVMEKAARLDRPLLMAKVKPETRQEKIRKEVDRTGKMLLDQFNTELQAAQALREKRRHGFILEGTAKHVG